MAFNKITQAAELEKVVGVATRIATGISTCTGSGQVTVTVPQFSKLLGIVGTVQAATTVGDVCICTATSGNTASLEVVAEGGLAGVSQVIMWVAWGLAKR
mgnify:CR=1 FL=1